MLPSAKRSSTQAVSILNSQDRIFIFIPLQIFGIFLRKLTGNFPAFLGVGGSLLDAEPLFLSGRLARYRRSACRGRDTGWRISSDDF